MKTHFQDLEFRRMMALVLKLGVTEGKRVCVCAPVWCVLVECDVSQKETGFVHVRLCGVC